MSTETYNPRERSFIRKPEPKTCPTCGQTVAPEVKPMNNHMNKYVNDISGREVVINSNEEYIEVKGVKFRRSDVPLPAKEVVKAPVVPPVVKAPVTQAASKPVSVVTPAPITQVAAPTPSAPIVESTPTTTETPK